MPGLRAGDCCGEHEACARLRGVNKAVRSGLFKEGPPGVRSRRVLDVGQTVRAVRRARRAFFTSGKAAVDGLGEPRPIAEKVEERRGGHRLLCLALAVEVGERSGGEDKAQERRREAFQGRKEPLERRRDEEERGVKRRREEEEGRRREEERRRDDRWECGAVW